MGLINLEYFISTLGTDNTIRTNSLVINRKVDDSAENDASPQKQKKKDKKYILDFTLKNEYIYDLEHNTVIPEALFQEVAKNVRF